MFYALIEDKPKRPKSFFKLICHKTEGKELVVGLHAVGRGVDEMMQAVAIAMKMGATKQDFNNAVAIHPTASEEIVLFDPTYV